MAIIKKATPGEMAAKRLQLIYTKAEQSIIREITRKRTLGLVDYADVTALNRVQEILRNMVDESGEYIPIAIKDPFYKAGDFESAPYGYYNAQALSSSQTAIVERLVDNLLADIEEAANKAYESAEEYLSVGRLEAGELRNLTLELAAQREAEGKGWNTIQNKMAAELTARGITSFVDKAGRKWNLSSYCAMATRTTGRQAQIAAALTADDWDLWQISKIGSTCPLCSVYEGRVYSKSGTDPDYPPLAMAFGKIDAAGSNDLSNTWLNIHPNCLVPGGTILCEGVMAESRRLYRGEVITLHTAGGDEITVTPNHPILTNRGFIAAGELQKGDKVIKTTGEYGRLIGEAPDNINIPTIVDEKLHALLQSVGGATRRMEGSSVQFHGDGSDGEVEVIFTNGLGINKRDTSFGENSRKELFPSAHFRWLKLFSFGSLFKIIKSAFSSSNSVMTSPCLVGGIKRVAINGEQFSNLRHGTAADFSDLGVALPFVMKGKKTLKKLSVRFFKSLGNIRKFFGLTFRNRLKTKYALGVYNVPDRNPEFLGCLPSSEPLLKKRLQSLWIDDAIVEDTLLHVGTSFYDGYVYNFESKYGFYSYNNIVTHNCLHSLVRYTTAGKTDEQIQRDKDFSSFTKRPANVDYRSKKQIAAYRDKEKARAAFRSDMKQFKKYQAALGNEMPKTFDTFMKHKKAGDEVYKEWEEKFRSLSSGAKKLEKTLESGIIESQEISGAISGARNPFGKKAEAHAKMFYDEIRKRTSDVKAISKTTGFDEDTIQKIKNYVFIDKHNLGEGRIDRFDPDYMMAESWRRLIDGNPQPHDITLLHHELLEEKMVKQGMTQDEAHRITSRTYNYDKEALEYYGKIKKFKKE